MSESVAPEVDILLTVYNGVRYLDEQIQSLQAQTHTRWRLWARDDGSDDGTLASLRLHAARDPRIIVVDSEGTRLGASAGFGWLMENAASDASYVMFCDADDSWLPRKIELTLEAMQEAESAHPGGELPVLVHTDLTVVDGELQVIADSFWHFEGISPQPARLNRLLVHNTVTGCTMMINRALRQIVTPLPRDAVMHDWWLALVAACFGRIVSVDTPTMLYRQHGRNDTGARYYPRGVTETVSRALKVATKGNRVKESLRRSARQAEALLERFEDVLSPDQVHLVSRYAGIPECGAFSRRLRLIQLRTLSQGWDRSLGLILRG